MFKDPKWPKAGWWATKSQQKVGISYNIQQHQERSLRKRSTHTFCFHLPEYQSFLEFPKSPKHDSCLFRCASQVQGHGLFVALWPPNFKWTSTTVTRYIDACFRLSTSSQNTPFHLLLTVFCAKLQMQMRKSFLTAPQRSMNGHEYGKAGNSKTQAYRQL